MAASGRRAHPLGAPDPVVADHALYHALGGTPKARQEAYRALFDAPLHEDFFDGLRAATNGNWALGDARFKRQVARATRRRVALLKGCRPKPRNDARQINRL
jgi:REP-associated tyrosine transposase